ncbi:hypothetical protein Taro_033397 [Colocasia esculenta]|uniref:Fumarylacetoacetase n=1 Tax=Colocasia esculenta TaxID=4460 RepID=A0A843WCD7_COLES|nr:hypothetical protein [Colocasia esculenta]
MAPLRSFVDVLPDSHFPLENLPYGVFRPLDESPAAPPRPGVAIGDYVLDLSAVAAAGLFDGPLLNGSQCFFQVSSYYPTSFRWMAGWGLSQHVPGDGAACVERGPFDPAEAVVGEKNGVIRLSFFAADEPVLRDNADLRKKCLLPMSKVQVLLPTVIGDYTDFFSSMHHARNCGTIFRGPENPIPPNWFHIPIAYHGRASSVVISGTDITRPRGQGPPAGNSPPYFGPSRKLDFELEMAAIIGPGNALGQPVDVNEAADHIFGLVLMNDWSARDIQAWEYVPLGPFLGKSFGTSISPWIVTLDALEPFVCDASKQVGSSSTISGFRYLGTSSAAIFS